MDSFSMSPFQSSINISAPVVVPKVEPMDEALATSEYLFGSDSTSRAIVPVENLETQLISGVVLPPPCPKYCKRSSELVRVTDLTPEDERYFRDVVRRTRMLFDSLRVFMVYEDEKRKNLATGPREITRWDLKAASLMRQQGLWLFRDKRTVGGLSGVKIGDVFFYRIELCVCGLHGQIQAGIDYVLSSGSASRERIATSIIVSGGYEDNVDAGDVITYAGHGGQDRRNRQVMHQKMKGGNLALQMSMKYGIEVRVIRGFKHKGSPSGKVYVYDGLYKITETWPDVGKSGFGIHKFKLVRMENQAQMGSVTMRFAEILKTRPWEVRPYEYVSQDLSKGKEKLPVLLYNDVDGNRDPMKHVQYLVASCYFPQHVYGHGNNFGCDCVGDCRDNCSCAKRNGVDFPYDKRGILTRGKPLIFECGPHCRCLPTCRNRVAQNGLRYRFEVFRSRESKWRVRSLDLIQAGSFICEYAGAVLTRELVPIFTMNGDNLIYPGRFAKRWKEWGDMSQIFKDYVCPAHLPTPPLEFALDVSKVRNIASYVSHSSSPNVFSQLVLYDHGNISLPRVMLFAMENIPPMRELSLDYGVLDG